MGASCTGSGSVWKTSAAASSTSLLLLFFGFLTAAASGSWRRKSGVRWITDTCWKRTVTADTASSSLLFDPFNEIHLLIIHILIIHLLIIHLLIIHLLIIHSLIIHLLIFCVFFCVQKDLNFCHFASEILLSFLCHFGVVLVLLKNRPKRYQFLSF